MTRIELSITEIKAVRPLLDAVAAVAVRWEEMTRCYGHTEDNVALAELLDDLADRVRELRQEGASR